MEPRDFFAGMALPEIIRQTVAKGVPIQESNVADRAYLMADAMMIRSKANDGSQSETVS